MEIKLNEKDIMKLAIVWPSARKIYIYSESKLAGELFIQKKDLRARARKGLRLLEIPNYIFHNIKRGYYLFSNVNNLYDVIHENKQPIWYYRPLNKIVKFWKERYCIPRSNRVKKWMLFDSYDYFETIKKEIS